MLKETLFRKVDTSETTVSQEVLFAEAFRKLERFDLLNARTEIFDYLEKKAILDAEGKQVTVEYLPVKIEETVYESHRIIQKIVKLKLENEVKIEILNEIILVFSSFIPWCYLETWKIYEKYLSSVENIIQEAEKIELATEELGYICNQFGFYQRQLAQFEKAIEKYEEALRIAEKTIGKEHPVYATRLNNLALVYSNQGRYDEAIEKFEEALRIGEKTIGKEHPEYAARLSNLATVYRNQGKYDEAIKKYEEALRITEKTIGKEHPDYATCLNNLANVYFYQEKYQNALDLYEEALRIFEKTLPENHPHIIQLRESVTLCRRILGK
ncbi:MAG TPA: tetratricopeptide repeat protein [Pyrinomonadaceae bacterium]|nr:tetratricopeptide repeat protein [Pyrinomonadaceae bacterium]